jgi:hypothetical protein
MRVVGLFTTAVAAIGVVVAGAFSLASVKDIRRYLTMRRM